MANGRRKNRHRAGTRNNMDGAVTNEGSEIGSVTVQEVDEKIETLTKRFDDLLLVVKDVLNMTGKVSSDVKRSISSRKLLDADKNSTQTVPERNFKLDVGIIEEFHSTKQFSTVALYQERFEKMREALMAMNYGFTEDYFIYSFLSGLKEEIRCLVWETKPETLDHAFNLARIHEIVIQVRKEKFISSEKLIAGENTLPYDSMEVFCTYDYPQKLHGLVGKRALSIICSTAIVHNLLDTKAAIVAGCKLEEAEPLLVKFVLGGYQAVSRFKTRLQWTIQGHEFVADMRVVDLGLLDMVLGRSWQFDYDVEIHLARERAWFVKEGKRFVLQMPVET